MAKTAATVREKEPLIQLDVRLPAVLVLNIRHAAIDERISVKEWCRRVFEHALETSQLRIIEPHLDRSVTETNVAGLPRTNELGQPVTVSASPEGALARSAARRQRARLPQLS